MGKQRKKSIIYELDKYLSYATELSLTTCKISLYPLHALALMIFFSFCILFLMTFIFVVFVIRRLERIFLFIPYTNIVELGYPLKSTLFLFYIEYIFFLRKKI